VWCVHIILHVSPCWPPWCVGNEEKGELWIIELSHYPSLMCILWHLLCSQWEPHTRILLPSFTTFYHARQKFTLSLNRQVTIIIHLFGILQLLFGSMHLSFSVASWKVGCSCSPQTMAILPKTSAAATDAASATGAGLIIRLSDTRKQL